MNIRFHIQKDNYRGELVMKFNIIDVHKSCLEFLLEYQSKHDDFYFVPRKINNKNRLEQGMYFRGNDDYLALTFWNKSDSKEQIYYINWSFEPNGVSSIELTCRDSNEALPYVIAIKEILESTGKDFKETKKNRWRYFYPSNEYYLNTLQDFIENDKPLIDAYLLKYPESGIPLADKDIDDQFVKTLPYYKDYMESIKKAKKTGSVKVKHSEYVMSLQHNELSNMMVDYLKKMGYSKVKAEENYVDIKCVDKAGNKIFFELKTAQTVKSSIREALGQLLEYNHYPNTKRADKLVIVTKYEPEQEDIQYLTGLRMIYKIPVYYQYFDMDKKELSKEY